MIIGLHHVMVTIPIGAESEARAFYCRLLGLPEKGKPESLKGRGGLWLDAGDREIHIGVEPDVDRTGTKAHLALQVDDLAAWRHRLQTAGVLTKDNVAIPGYERFEIRDPFGNRLEFIQAL